MDNIQNEEQELDNTADELDMFNEDETSQSDVEGLKGELAKKDALIRKQQAILKKKQINPSDDKFKQKVEFLLTKEGKELESEEFEFIDRFAAGSGKSYSEAKNDPFVKAALDSIRQQRLAESASVDSDTAKSDIERKYTADQLNEMPLSEMEKLLPKS